MVTKVLMTDDDGESCKLIFRADSGICSVASGKLPNLRVSVFSSIKEGIESQNFKVPHE